MYKNATNLKNLPLVLTIALILTLLSGAVSMDYAVADGGEGLSNSGSGNGDKVKTEAMTGVLVLLAVGTGLALNGDLYKNFFLKDDLEDCDLSPTSPRQAQERAEV